MRYYDLCPGTTPSAAIGNAAQNRAVLAMPPMEEAGALAAENVRLRGTAPEENGLRWVRPTIRYKAVRWPNSRGRPGWSCSTRPKLGPRAYRQVNLPSLDPQGLIFLAGHQPELFHPGVWFKNFALGALARRHGARP